MAYQSKFFGQEIDDAIQAVRDNKTIWSGKQEKLVGDQGQVVGFDAAGNAIARGTQDLVGPKGDKGDPGPQGPPGVDGATGPAGAPGEDGFSPTVSVAEITGGHRVTITDADGPQSFDVMDGKNGTGGGETAGVSSFNGRSGAVVPGNNDYTADMVGARPATWTPTAAQVSVTPPTGMTSTNVQGAVSELFQSVSEGKALIASAVTGKGVNTAADASFQTMHDNILAIPTGGLPDNIHTITLEADPSEGGSVFGGGIASNGMTITVGTENADDYLFNGWKENGIVVSKDLLYSFPVSSDRNLTASFLFPQYTPGVDWWETALPRSVSLNSVAYGNGKFVAVAGSGTASGNNSNILLYSEDGINWEETTLPYSAYWRSVTFGNGKFIAISGARSGSSSNIAAYSEDGINWTSSTLPLSTYWSSVTYGDGKFVAVAGIDGNTISSSNKVAYSEDGITWKSATLPKNMVWSSVTYGDGKFVAVAHVGVTSSGSTYATNAVAYSSDGITWKSATLSLSAMWSSVTYGDGKFVAVADGKNGYSVANYSTDGITWESITLPEASLWKDVAYGDGRFITIASGTNKAAYSEDGITWVATALPLVAYWRSVAYGNGKFVAVVNGDKAAYSDAFGPV